MELEKQVANLELSKRLKELGVNQESLFYWDMFDQEDDGSPLYKISADCNRYDASDYAAFTVAELGEMLPSNLNHAVPDDIPTGMWLNFDKSDDGEWIIGYGEDGINHHEVLEGKTEADARAKMLIYLLGNKLIQD